MNTNNKKLKLEGFNNLTKTLSFNIYDVCYAQTKEQRRRYLEYINEAYSARRLTRTLEDVARIIGATVLNIAHQDYAPQGASVTMLIAEESLLDMERPTYPEAVVAHLDKSHIAVHTYPDCHPHHGISTFRADIDVSTCGYISPLKALDYLIDSFDSDIVTIDYRIRGFTRDRQGRKHFIDHDINSVQNFIKTATKRRYHMIDVNLYQEQIFHTRMMINQLVLDNYLFAVEANELEEDRKQMIHRLLQREIEEIFYGRNVEASSEGSVLP